MQGIFIFTESTCLRLIAHQISLIYLLPEELDRGDFLTPPPTKIGLSINQTTIGLKE